MKKIRLVTDRLSSYALAFTLTIFPLQAFALDFTPDASRVISDPAYLPLQNQIYGSTEYSYETLNYHSENDVGALTGSHNSKISTAEQALAYGLTDDFAFQVSDDYEWNRTESNNYSTTSTDTRSTGFTDPTFGATWRALDQKQYPLNWDLIATYAPNLINSTSASTTDDGTVARGGQEAEIGTALSYKTRDFTVYGSGVATYLGSRESMNQTTDLDANYGSSWQYRLAVNTQTRFTDLWSVNAGASETFNTQADGTTANASPKAFVNESIDTTGLNGAINFQVIPNRLVASLTDTYSFIGDGHNDYTATPTSDTSTEKERANTIGIELRYAY